MKIIADQNIPYVQEIFDHLGEVTVLPGRAITASEVENADMLLVRSVTKVNEALLKESAVKFVGSATTGFDHVDTAFLKKRKIEFAHAPGSNATSVAEYVISALLCLSKKYGFALKDRSIGIIGAGNVGSRLEARCKAFDMKVVLNDPPLFERTNDEKYRSLSECCACDIVTLHVPLTRSGLLATFHMANEDFFNSLKQGAIFINASRGEAVDEKALHAALDSGKVATCVCDVWENEPYPDTQLITKAGIATPHIAGYSFDGKVRGVEMVYRAAVAYLKLQSEWRLTLPKPSIPEVIIPGKFKAMDDYARAAIFPVYDVSDDDRRFRGIVDVDAEKRGNYFDSLRKEYPERREFANTQVVCEKAPQKVKEMLRALEFMV
ncbi:MAG: hypothetical protein A2487_07010 [Candidatus Raymondbacteria bacterium RifOxyC12_full_50_8]|uniref:Erythronate-4-phosphate dehydrogenase n=1 Tax=Candidatus Raymondbacteria bacterium RIFOXYD12_FULL_49_13 TaxID=1817890 RepID=A0A1F7FCP0_UNCRA|nr:MAG: hypothetical protein A2350_00045 [Candidatus Raymondbacteria bacterium RifOxyB12_full_50_8]OGJ89523.1 MAG: hypothetical protein A2248_03350 [Candidatus Raymondbacteria bacterium RIFOXYA2_FULL_49_16]OGJ96802.1 MAG: hypothetical protein A2487_07010 [Candidatus Raymondbacteria bacterium RifOxyC12_full_50_8]OGK04226.1 MAG: hypothetical protein A2519_17855 [Candidatus Raymondbacteria bacterium RIFOXYD12_FULL_49_13]OGP42491.1 MAG: hypothetical protein A2324_17385 [Candidatus Raymondbacteria b